MAQYLKDDVRARIDEAALRMFASRGFGAATMGQIARSAGVSTGNLYRYHPGKEELFYSLVTPAFVRRFETMMTRRVRSLAGVHDISTLPETAPYRLISEELLRLCIDDRLRVVILLGRAQGTRYDKFPDRMVRMLVKLALAHFRTLDPVPVVTRTMRFDLQRIYTGFVRSMADILAHFEREDDIGAAVVEYEDTTSRA